MPRPLAGRRFVPGGERLEARLAPAASGAFGVQIPLSVQFQETGDEFALTLTGSGSYSSRYTLLDPGDLSQVSADNASGQIQGNVDLRDEEDRIVGSYRVTPVQFEADQSFAADGMATIVAEMVGAFTGTMNGQQANGKATVTLDGRLNLHTRVFLGDVHVEVESDNGLISETLSAEDVTATAVTDPAGFQLPDPALASVGDLVWSDDDRDGMQDLGEPGLAGVDVILVSPGANGIAGDGDDQAAAQATTNRHGAYSFVNVAAGQYYLRYPIFAHEMFPPANQGGDEEDSDVAAGGDRTELFPLTAGQHLRAQDAGIVTLHPAYHNLDLPSDVNRDTLTTPADILEIVQHLRRGGAVQLPARPTTGTVPPPFVDANADRLATVADILVVVQVIRRAHELGEGELIWRE